MRYCQNVKRIARATDDNNQNMMTRLRCKKWSCPYCAYVNRAVWIKRIMATIADSNAEYDWFFMTITAHGDDHRDGTTLDALQSKISVLLKRMRRANAYDDMPYVRVFEAHKSGEYHAHFIIQWSLKEEWDRYRARIEKRTERKWSESTWLSRNAKEVGLGYIVDYQTIRVTYDPTLTDDNGHAPSPSEQGARQVVMYVFKYMTKDNMNAVNEQKSAKTRMIQASQHFPAKDSDKSLEWDVLSDYSVYDWWIDNRNMLDLNIDRTLQPSDFANDRYQHEKTIDERYQDDS